MKTAHVLMSLGLALALAVTGWAAEQEKKGGRSREGRGGMMMGGSMDAFRMLDKLDLSAEQKEKVEALRKELGPKMKEAAKKADAILTDEQKKAREEAMKELRDSGKRGPEAFQAVQKAMKLTDEQQEKLREAQKEQMAMAREVREKVMGLLTPEQQEKVKAMMKDAAGKRGDGGRRKAQEKSEK